MGRHTNPVFISRKICTLGFTPPIWVEGINKALSPLFIYVSKVSVVQERCFIGWRSNNQSNQENEREGLELEGLLGEGFEREGVKGFLGLNHR